jgi:hypothetical protein
MTSLQEDALQIIKDTLDSLQRSGLIEPGHVLDRNTVLLGPGSPLDSLAFVTFIADMEERLNQRTGKDVALIVEKIHEFNAGADYLNVEALARYVASEIGAE